MRIYRLDEQWKPRFSLPWEAQQLEELGDHWVAFSIPGDSYTIGRIHAQSHEITFFQNIEGQNNLLVALEFPEQPHRTAGRVTHSDTRASIS
jgi:hypothetical protein